MGATLPGGHQPRLKAKSRLTLPRKVYATLHRWDTRGETYVDWNIDTGEVVLHTPTDEQMERLNAFVGKIVQISSNTSVHIDGGAVLIKAGDQYFLEEG